LGPNDEAASLSDEQRLVLQAIYDRFREYGKWPTFISVNRPLRRGHGIDTRAIFKSLPDSLVVKPRQGTGPTDTDDLVLRLPGIEACRGGSEDTDRFVRMLRWFADQELAYDPPPGDDDTMPRVTSDNVAAHLGLQRTDPGYDAALERLRAMISLDNWGLGRGSDQDGWYVNLGPEVWRFRAVQTVGDVEQAREQWIAEARAEAPHFRTGVQATWSGNIIEQSDAPINTSSVRPRTSYVDEKVTAAIEAKAGVSPFNVSKLVALIAELNDSYQAEHAYAAHALLRAILDHVPPILGYREFAEVANNYKWPQTDTKYIRKLLDFKAQGDDVLHRRISAKADLISMEDLPPRAWLNRLLQECSDKL
jgi:hypothetical protein